MNKKVADILLRKGSSIISVSPHTSVLEALKIMSNQNIGSIMVIDNGRFVGLMTRSEEHTSELQSH